MIAPTAAIVITPVFALPQFLPAPCRYFDQGSCRHHDTTVGANNYLGRDCRNLETSPYLKGLGRATHVALSDVRRKYDL
jgi:hypothetical protein